MQGAAQEMPFYLYLKVRKDVCTACKHLQKFNIYN